MKTIISIIFLLAHLISFSLCAKTTQPIVENYATKAEVEELRKQIDFYKSQIKDISTEKINSKIESETASYIVLISSALTRNALMVLSFAVSILTLIVALIGVPKLHDYMNNLIRTTHKKYEEESESRIFYKVYMQLSHGFYLYYKSYFINPDHPSFLIGITLATWYADGAIQIAKKLPDGEREKWIIVAELHRAYHAASESIILGFSETGNNQLIALKTANKYYHIVDNIYDNKTETEKWVNCKETIAWVYILLGDKNEQEQGKNIITSILKIESISLQSLKAIVNNYFHIIRASDKFDNDTVFQEFINTQGDIFLGKKTNTDK